MWNRKMELMTHHYRHLLSHQEMMMSRDHLDHTHRKDVEGMQFEIAGKYFPNQRHPLPKKFVHTM